MNLLNLIRQGRGGGLKHVEVGEKGGGRSGGGCRGRDGKNLVTYQELARLC